MASTIVSDVIVMANTSDTFVRLVVYRWVSLRYSS
jgi:hypothetical protein